MFQNPTGRLLIMTLPVLLSTAVVFAGRPDRPMSEKHQARLLEKFADQGIDADNDGTLTRAEIHAFFEANPDLDRGKFNRRGGRHRGKGGDHGPGGKVMHLLRRLEKLDPDQIPEGILEQRPKLDADGDGTLSSEEWTAHVEQKRTKLLDRLLRMEPTIDTDGDEAVSAEELAAFSAARQAAVRAKVLTHHPETDTDGDGILSDAEFEAFQTQRRADRAQRILENHPEADLDGDGQLSKSELDAFRDGQPRWRGKGKGKGHGREAGPRHRPAWDEEIVQ